MGLILYLRTSQCVLPRIIGIGDAPIRAWLLSANRIIEHTARPFDRSTRPLKRPDLPTNDAVGVAGVDNGAVQDALHGGKLTA